MADAGAKWRGVRVGEALRQAGERYADELFLLDADERLTFAEVDAAVERFLESLPMVHQAMVCGVPHPRLGEVCFAFVEPAPGEACTSAAVIAASRGAIADYKVPRQVVVMEEFPRTTTNKIMRYVLQARANELSQGC